MLERISRMKDGEWDHLHDALKDDANVVAQTTGSASIPHPAIPIPAINVRPRRIGTTRRGAGHDNRLWLLPLTIAIGIVACVATYFAWPATDSLDPLATAPRRVRNQIARPRFASEIPDYDSADTPFFHNLEDESPDEIVSNRPRQNVPDALQSLKLFRIPGGISADTYVEEFSDRDYSTENHLIISVKKRSTGTPRRKTYLRFDLRDAGFQMQDIEDVFLLLTMNTRGIDADAVYRFSVSLLRDDSPAAEWQASGPNRIRYANTPEQVRSIDLLPCGSAHRLSRWYEDRKVIMMQHRNKQMTLNVVADTDGLLTFVLEPDRTEVPEMRLISSEGDPDLGPCLAIRLRHPVPR
ncbi:MAG: hypothetical protein AAFP90_04455, partial [Planctomycetota bacterium]